MSTTNDRARWLALIVLCLGDLMIVLDTTIVNVALPSIKDDLGFSQTSLSWVVNAYLLTFGGFLLLGGRLGDLFGYRRLFLIGTVVFVLASLGCGVADSQEMLVVGRAIQGLGAAVVSAVALSLIMVLFTEPAERAKAMGIFGFVLAGGGTMGVLLGGFLTELSWHWIFLVNLPVGIAVYVMSIRLLPTTAMTEGKRQLDMAGAITITASLMIAVYAIVNGNDAGWMSTQTLGLLGGAVVLLVLFLIIELRTKAPLVPLGMFRFRNFSTANVVGILMAAGLFAAFFMTSLFMERVLGYKPKDIGLAYLAMTLVWGAESLFLSDKLVMKYGIKKPAVAGFAMFAVGIIILARVPVHADYFVDILPGMILQGAGAGIAFNPLLLAAMGDVKPHESGIASGVVNTAFMMGGALGLASLSSLAASRTSDLLASGHNRLDALTGGYHIGFLMGAIFAAVAGLLALILFRPMQHQPGTEQVPEGAESSTVPAFSEADG